MCRNLILLIFLLSGCFTSLYAQKTFRAFPMEKAISIDGVHDPKLWKGADSATQFVQMEPVPGHAASESTVVYLGFDHENIYISASLYQESEILAKALTRDVLTKGDDSFVLIVDPYNDNRSGYGFWTNALGIQTDFRINDDGRSIDTNWDTEWLTASRKHPWGWTVEMSIPFKSLRFKPGSNTWGINFGRSYTANLETAYWSGTLTDDFRISQGGELSGITVPKTQSKLTLYPYATLRYENNDFSGIRNSVKPDAGGDMKWQISPNVTADATINPDFATVEADQEQINLTRYEINYPEKRLFFQEGNEMYNTRIKTFYSRRIQDILYGAKINGKTGKYNFNALNARTLQMSEEDEAPSYFSTVRVKRDFLESSSVGLTTVDKRNDTSFVTSFSGDYVLNLGETWKLTGQFVASVPGDLLSHSAWFMRFAKETNYYHMHVRYTELGENFKENVNQTGYVVDDDRREFDSDLSYRWWIRNNFFRYIEVESRNNVFWSRTTGVLRSWNYNQSVELYLQNRFSLEYRHNNEFKLFDKEYYNHRHSFDLGYNTAEWSYAELAYSFGHNFDRDFQRYSFDGRVKVTEKMSLAYSGDLIKFTPDLEENSTFINILTLNYNFTNNLWVKLFAQNSTSSSKIYFYGLAGWRFRPPFGAIYLIYSHDQEAELMGELAYADALFLKITLPIALIR